MTLPTDAASRKQIPIASGALDYFPAALIAVAELSRIGNEQHNPGEPLHWARGKSTDEEDALMRHFMERGTVDTDGVRHSTKMAWRALALLQKELEAAGAPMARGARESVRQTVERYLPEIVCDPTAAPNMETIISPETGDSAEVDLTIEERVEREMNEVYSFSAGHRARMPRCNLCRQLREIIRRRLIAEDANLD